MSEKVTASFGKKYRLAVVTCITDAWGGSEELWARSVPHLLDSCDVLVMKGRIQALHPEFRKLEGLGVLLSELDAYSKRSLRGKLLFKMLQALRGRYRQLPVCASFEKKLKRFRPHLVLIGQGINFDGVDYARICIQQQVPYVLVSQKAVDFYWPPPQMRASIKEAYEQAKKCFFVSRHNQELTEEQLGFRIRNASVVFNPVKLPVHALPYPSEQDGVRLACIGRLFLIDKGQDMLLRVLAQEKWKRRPVTVSLIGSGPDEGGLRAMADLLGLRNVTFAGFQNDLHEIWSQHHALILPSRSEGLALVTVEAMAAGRPVIVTNAGGHSEIVSDGFTGFIGPATTGSLDETLERAWQQLPQWRAIGERAAAFVKNHVPAKPEINFAKELTDLLYA